MKRQGGGFGVLILLVVVAIVLFLAARAWKGVMPEASQSIRPSAPVSDHGQTEAAGEVRSGNLPDMNEMRNRTSDHADSLRDALEESN